ncbi:MAG: hypothetical protein NXH78_07025 [Hyphomonadaceae bacterium]|nr:hypothetical protein [Hyphomonadaceae bacterium]
MKLKTIAVCGLYVAVAVGATAYFATSAAAQAAEPAEIAGPAVILSDVSDRAHRPAPPEGVPPALHRKVLHLYKRIHNAYPDASRQRIFLKIAEELGINPRRLWNAYHPSDRVRRDVKRRDIVRDRQIDRVRDRQTDRVRDRVTRIDRARIDRPVRDRPVRDRPGRN